MLKESPSKTLCIEELDEQELFDQLNEMPGVFKTSLPKHIDRGKFGAWDSPSHGSPSPVAWRNSGLEDSNEFNRNQDLITLPNILHASQSSPGHHKTNSMFEPKLFSLSKGEISHSSRYQKHDKVESKTNKIVSLERDPKFQKDLNDTLHNIKRFRGFKDRTWGRLQELH